MKTEVLLIIFFIFSIKISYSQDIIYLNDGSEIESKVTELTTESIKYKNFNQLGGPLRNILIKDVYMIIYENGTKEVLKNIKVESNLLTTSSSIDNNINLKNTKINKEYVFVEVEDCRDKPSIIGTSEYSGMTSYIKDKNGAVFPFTSGKIKEKLKEFNFKNSSNHSYILEIKIKKLSYNLDTGFWGRDIIQNCEIVVQLINEKNSNILYDKKFDSYSNNKASELKKMGYKKILRSPYSTLEVVVNDVINKLLKDIEFQYYFSD